jgi:hypothetical protein
MTRYTHYADDKGNEPLFEPPDPTPELLDEATRKERARLCKKAQDEFALWREETEAALRAQESARLEALRTGPTPDELAAWEAAAREPEVGPDDPLLEDPFVDL